MDFLEQLFNLWPDGGDGKAELALAVAFVLLLTIVRTLQRLGGEAWLLRGAGVSTRAIHRTAGDADAKNH